MSVTVATGVVNVRADIDESGVVRAAHRAGQQSGDAFTRGMDGRLRDASGRFVSTTQAAGNAMTGATQRANIFTRALRAVMGAFRGAGDSAGRNGQSTNIFSRALRGLTGMASSAMGAVSSLARSLGPLGIAIVGSIPLMDGLVGSIQNILPAASGAATGLFALIQGFAAIKIGTSGIGDAIKAAFEPTAKSAGTATNAAKQHADAMQRVQDATESAARANTEAARRVKDAERNLSAAQKDAIAVQKELTQARKDAKEELQDLNSSLANSELSLRDATLGVQDAEQNLREVQAKGNKATQLERLEAQLQLDQAKQRLKDQQVETDRLRTKTADANKAGINGTQAMTQWQDKVASANENVASQEQALTEARRSQAETVADGQKAIAKAMEALTEKTATAAPVVNKFADAMAKLSPSARAFVQEIIRLKPAWDNLKMGVQESLFSGMAGSMRSMSASVMPVLRTGLMDTSTALNSMWKGVNNTAASMAQNGILSKAMAGANLGLTNLSQTPGKLLESLTKLAIAGTPVWDKFTKGIANKTSGMLDKVTKGLETGTLAKSIDTAMNLIKDLGTVLKNVGKIFNNVFGVFQEEGGGIITVLKDVTTALVGFTAEQGIKDMIGALASVFSNLGKVVVPLLGTTLRALSPIIQALAPPLNVLVKALGAALTPIIQALGPVLTSVAQALGSLVVALSPLLVILGDLIARLLIPLTPIFEALSDAFIDLAPVIALLGQAIVDILGPALDALPFLINPIVNLFTILMKALVPVLTKLLTQLAPVWEELGKTFGDLLISLGPLLVALGLLISKFLVLMLPSLTPIIGVVSQLALVLSGQLASVITNVLIPAANLLTAVINGDWADAWTSLKTLIGGIWQYFKDTFMNIVTIVKAGVQLIIAPFKFLYDVLIGHSIIPDLVNGIVSWFKSLVRWSVGIFQDLWTRIVDKVVGLKNSVITQITNMKNGLVLIFTTTKNSVVNLAGAMRDLVVNRINDLKNKTLSVLNLFKTSAIGAFVAAKNGIKTAWDALQGIASKPVQFMINTVYNKGIRTVWNAVVGAFGGKKLGEVKGFARGGVLPGQSTFRQGDDQLVPMRKGEGVYVSEAMKNPYERARLFAVNKAAMSGQSLTKFQGSGQTGPGFALGGIFDGIGNIASGAWDKVKKGYGWLKDTFSGAIKAGVKTLVDPAINKIPGSGGFTGILKDAARNLVGRLVGAGDKGETEAGGGAASKGVDGALRWARSQAGKPYQWGGAFNPSFDCSGFMSSIQKVIQGLNPKGRLWSTHSFSGSTAPQGWQYHLNSPFKIGITNAGVGHTAGTLKGTNVESRGGEGVVVGSRARGYNNPMFGSWYGFKPAIAGHATGGIIDAPWVSRDMGGLLPDGVGALNTSGTAEVVSTLDQLKALVAAGKGSTYIFNEGSIVLDASKIKSIEDVVKMIESLKVTSRQFGARL